MSMSHRARPVMEGEYNVGPCAKSTLASAIKSVPGLTTDLPRLAIIADVPVERTGGGALLLYRLLKDYPRDRLLAVSNPDATPPRLGARLPGVAYRDVRYSIPRTIRNRFNPFWPVVMAGRMRRS